MKYKIIESLRADLAALYAAGVIGKAMLEGFDALAGGAPVADEGTDALADLRTHPALAAAYLGAALQALETPAGQPLGKRLLREVVQAHGGPAAAAAGSGMDRDVFELELSPEGEVTLRGLLAVLRVASMRLSVIPVDAVPTGPPELS